MSLRFDRGELLARPITLPDGSMIFEAVIARAGIQEYRRDGKTIVEYRDPKEVFAPEHVSSYEFMAITDYHPEAIDEENDGHVTIANRESLGRGSVVPGSLRRDGMNLIAKLHVTSLSLIAAMKNGRNAVSCGYDQEFVSEPGHTPDGARYDGRQTKMRGNHVAIVDVARAGNEARARTDSATKQTTEKKNMFKTIEEATAAYNAEKLRADAATDQLSASKTATAAATKRADEADAAKDAALAKAEKAEKLRVDGEKAGKAAAKARVALEEKAVKVLRCDAADVENKTDLELKVEMIEKLTGKELDATKAKSEAYVEARYDAAIDAEGEADEAIADVRTAVRESGSARHDSGEDTATKAREDMIKERQNAWMPKKKGE